MKFGMPTLIENDSIESCAALCKELNLDFIELNMNLPQYQINTIDIQKLKAFSRKENIFFIENLPVNVVAK